MTQPSGGRHERISSVPAVALRAQSDRIFHREDAEEALTRTVFTEPPEKLLRDGIADGQ